MGRQVVNIRTDLDGELARSSDFCDLLVKKYKCGLQTTGGCSSCILQPWKTRREKLEAIQISQLHYSVIHTNMQ